MSFGSGLSGVAAASKDLSITGNNIANASTTGFKASRAEFGDAYTTSILGMGQDPIGSGVNLNNVGQKFEQGNISQTKSVLDLAIDGNGFFVTERPNGSTTYTRSGIFGIDQNGYVVTNQGGVLQGFDVNESGIVSGILTDLRVDAGNQPPRGTHGVDAEVNVPAGANVLQSTGSTTRTNGLAVGVAQAGPAADTVTTLSTIGVPTTGGTASQVVGGPIGFTGVAPGITFPWQPSSTEAASSLDFTLIGPNFNNGVALTSTIQPFSDSVIYSDVNDLVASINANIKGEPELAGKVQAVANEFGGISFEMAGVYATDGSSIVGVVDNVNNLSDPEYLNFGSVGLTLAGNKVAGLTLVNADTGSTLTGGLDLTTLDSTINYFESFTTGVDDTFAYNVNIGGTIYSESFTFDTVTPGYATLGAFVVDLNAQMSVALAAAGQFQLNGSRLEFVVTGAASLGPSNISITSVASGTTSSVDISDLGMTNSGLFTPTISFGQTENDLLEVVVDGITHNLPSIGTGTVADADTLVALINTQLAATPAGAPLAGPNLDAHVQAYQVGGVLHFTRIGQIPLLLWQVLHCLKVVALLI
ncbi:MAG: flagellar hook-basal body complex protein [Reinekea sp.]